jgi:hypothetical protein
MPSHNLGHIAASQVSVLDDIRSLGSVFAGTLI